MSTILGQETNRALLVRVKDPAAVARSQGKLAAFAAGLAPATIEAKVYEIMGDEFKKKLASQGIEADVSVVEPKSFQAAGSSHIATDVAFAIGGMGVVGLLWFLFSSGRRS
jgi:hypothetical protein